MPPFSSNTICLIDDEPTVLKALGRLLASEGLTSEKFSGAPAFLDFVRCHPVRLAIIDIRMPDMTGLELLDQLRLLGGETRAILITAEEDPVYRATALAAGASAFFLKPFDDHAFMKAVRDALAAGASPDQ